MKQIDYLRKSRKNCSALLMACALTFMLLTTTLSFAQTNSLTLGCPTRNGSGYSFTSLTLSTSTSVRGVTISFSENPEGCSISATTPSDWNLSSTSNDYVKSYTLPTNVTSEAIQNFLRSIVFSVPSNTLKNVQILLQTDDGSSERQVIYYSGNRHYYEYVAGTVSWTNAYTAAKARNYCGRQGYLATLTSAGEDQFVSRLVQNAMWLGGTRLTNTGSEDSQYFRGFSTSSNAGYWYWACGPEKGDTIINATTAEDNSYDDAMSWYANQNAQYGYTNWAYARRTSNNSLYSAEPNGSGNNGESCLTILKLPVSDNAGWGISVTRSSQHAIVEDAHFFGWNDVAQTGGSSGQWQPKGYLVEYGDLPIGDSGEGSESACAILATGMVGSAEITRSATISGNSTICADETATLTLSFDSEFPPYSGKIVDLNGNIISFSTDENPYTFTVTPNETTTYTVSEFTDNSSTTGSNGCSGVYNIVYEKSGSVTVTVNNPQVALNDIESVAICAGASTTLTATTTGTVTDNVAYAWSTGATENEITVAPSATTTYTVTATATQGGCTATATKSVAVTVNTPQVALNDIESVAICAGASTTLTATTETATGEVSYAWSTGATENEITVTPSETTTYTVTATANYNGCMATATKSVTVMVNALPTATVSVTNETCTGNDGTATVAAAGGNGEYTFDWSNGQSSATATNLSSSNGGVYTVTVTDGNNCVATATATIEFNNNFTVSASNTAVCSGEPFTINPTTSQSHTAKYTWAAPTATGIDGATAGTDASNISGTLTNTTTSATSITYTVTATTENGLCTADSFDVVVTVYAPVTGGSIQKDFIVCNGLDSVVTLTNEVLGNGGFNGAYIWQQIANGTTTTIEGANGETYTPTSVVGTVQYQRVYTTGCGNKPSNVVSVTYYGDVNPGTVVCSGEGNDCAANYCYGSDINVTLSTSGINVGSGTTPTIQWQQSVNGGDWTNISGANATTYTYNKNNFTEPIKFRYTIQLPSCDPVPSNNVHNIGVWALPVVSIAEVATLCPSAASTDITGTIEPPTTPNYTYHWSPGSGLELSNLPESATSEISNTITGTFPDTICNATYSASLYVEDGNGCKSNTATKTFTVVDTIRPTFTRPVDITIYTNDTCGYDASVSATGDVTDEDDNCSTGIEATYTDETVADATCEGKKVITRTWSLVDNCDNSAADQVQTITVLDTIRPTFTRPVDITIYTNDTCGYDASVSATGDVTNESDNCSTGIEATYTDETVADATCEGKKVITRTWSLVDKCGNAAETQVQTITVLDNIAPTFTAPANATIYTNANCEYNADPSATGDVTDEDDNCSTGINATYSDTIADGDCAGKKIITRTWSLADKCGNAAETQVQTITVLDTIRPTFTRPADITIYTNDTCGYDASVSVTGDVTNEADNCSTGINATYSDTIADGDCAGKKIITRTWSLADKCGNAAETQVQIITVEDNIAPTFTAPANTTIYTDAHCGYNADPSVTGSVTNEADNCSTGIEATYSDVVADGDCAGKKIITRTWSLADKCGNAAETQVQTITVLDTIRPTFTRPADITIYADATCGYNADTTVTGDVTDEDDNCSTNLTVTYRDAEVDGNCEGTKVITRTWRVVDACGNVSISDSVQTITVLDTIRPTFTCPSNTEVNCDADQNYHTISSLPSLSDASDNCTSVESLVKSYKVNGNEIVLGTTTLVPGSHTVTVTVTDLCGNDEECTYTITVGSNEEPVVNCPGGITVECYANVPTSYANYAAFITAGGTVTDDLNAIAEESFHLVSEGELVGTECDGTITRTYGVKDAAGNEGTCEQVITIKDNKAPTFTRPADITIYTNDTCGYDASVSVTGDVTNEADNCSTGINATYSDTIADGDCEGTKVITRTWSLVDNCGNEAETQVQTITVEDTIRPTFTRPADITIYTDATCDYNADTTITGSVTNKLDNCSTNLTVTYRDAEVDGNCEGTKVITRTWRVVDACGNVSISDSVQTITVLDTIRPTFTRPADITIYTNDTCGYDASVSVTGDVTNEADNCSTGINATYSDTIADGDCAGKKIITRTWSLADKCGNAAETQVQTITVEDNVAPTFTRPIDITIYTDANCNYDASVSVTGDVTDEKDNCSTGINAIYSDVVADGDCAGKKTITRTWSLVDACGNAAADQVQTITVLDTVAPTFTAPANTTIYTDANCIYNAEPSVTGDVTDEKDNCSTGINAIYSDVVADGDCAGKKTITRTWSLVDACGNAAADQVQTITVSDTTRPTFTRPADITIYTDANCDYDASVSATGDVTDEDDNCSTGIEAIYSDVETDGDCEGTKVIKRTWSLEDKCGNAAADQVQTITVSDTTRPTFTRPADITIYTNDTCGYDASVSVTGDVTDEKDNCSTGINATYSDTIADGDCAGKKIITRTWSLADKCGNAAADQVQTITVSDTTRPTFTRPADITIYTDANCDYDASVSATGDVTDEDDNCSTGIEAIYSDVETDGDCEGTKVIKRTWSLEDKCGNRAADQVQTITVSDTTRPTFTRPADITIYTDANCDYDASVSATGDVTDEDDNCSTGIEAIYSDVETDGDCEGTKVIKRTWSLEDKCGNAAADQVQTITVSDTTRPTFTRPADITIYTDANCDYDASVSATGDVTDEDDNCSTGIEARYSDVETDGDCEGTKVITRTWSLVDACGNAAETQVQTITVLDTTAPVIDSINLNRTLTSTNCVFKIPDLTTEVRNISNDLCTPNADLIISQSPAAGTELAQTDTAQNVTVTVTVMDLCDNASTKDVVVVVPAKVTVMATADPATICYGATSQLTATPSNVVGTATYNWTPSDGLNNATIANPVATLTTTTTYTVEVTDGNGCAATATTTITVNPEVVMDTVAPMTLCVGDVTSYNFTTPLTVGTMSYAWTNSNTAIGLAANGDGDIPSFTPTNTTNAPINATITVTPSHTYNGITCVGDPINFTITVRPSIKTPGNVTFTCPADTTVVLSYSDCEQVVNIGEPEFENHMLGMNVNITNDAPEGNIFPEGTTIVTWTATDECGAFLTCTQNVVIQFPSCGDSIADFDGYRYSSVRIGCQCWTGENARSEHYSDGTPVDNFRYYNDSDSLENIYGKLYTWYTAVRVPEGDDTAVPADSIDPLGNSYVQGICPEGWALPTVDEYMLMIANSGDATHAKDGSNLYWLPGYEGQPPFSGFDAYGAGKYNGAIDRYQELLGKTHFWTTLSGSGSETATTVEINYYCAEGLQTKLSKGDGVSVRCIRKR